MKSLLKKSLCAVLTLLMVVSMLTCAFTAASASDSTSTEYHLLLADDFVPGAAEASVPSKVTQWTKIAADTGNPNVFGGSYLISATTYDIQHRSNADLTIDVKDPGYYYIWVHSKKNYSSSNTKANAWQFQINVDGSTTYKDFGGASDVTGWYWECDTKGYNLTAGTHTVTLIDKYCSWARCDAVLVIKDNSFTPADTYSELLAQLEALNTPATPDLDVSAASVTLQSNLQANFKVDSALFSETAGYSDPYMTFTLNGKTTTVDKPIVDGDYYVFRFSDIAPDKMNDTISWTLSATKDGVVEQKSGEYSIATYCKNLLGNSTDSDGKLRTLLVDMLNYGAASQNYTGHNTDKLANADLTETQKAWGTSATPALTDSLNTAAKTVENATATWIGAALRLTDRVEMKFIIDTASIEGLTVKFTNAAGNVEYATVASGTFERRAAGGYYVYFDGFDASQMSEVVYVTAYNGDTAVSNTIAYSVETYAYAKQNSSVPNLGALVIAMMKYGNAAKAYASV